MDTLTLNIGSKTYTDDLLTNDLSIDWSESEMVFYYKVNSNVYVFSAALTITVTAPSSSSALVLYIIIALSVLAGFVLIYGVVLFAKYCLRDRRSAVIMTPFQNPKWVQGTSKRYDKILLESPETNYDASANAYKQVLCCVCLAELAHSCLIRKLICSHIFHKDCIESWIKTKISNLPTCPVCNVVLTNERPEGMPNEQLALRVLTSQGENNTSAISHLANNALATAPSASSNMST